MNHNYTLSILVKNTSGVLTRISGLFARRGYNIRSLSVGETENEELSRITIGLEGDEYVLDQIKKQLSKLIDVVKIKQLKGSDAVYRELMLVKVACGCEKACRHHRNLLYFRHADRRPLQRNHYH